jgi:hypothetical protein
MARYCIVLVMLCLWPALAWAGDWRHDLADGDAYHQAQGADFPEVGRVPGVGSLVLIDSQWALTAAHVADNLSVGGTVSFDGVNYTVDGFVRNPT